MPLSKSAALEAVRTCLAARATETVRLDRIDVAVKPLPDGTIRVVVPDGAPAVFTQTARRAETPYLALALNTFGQVMKVDGLYQPSAPERSTGWQHWQRNRMDARQTGLHHSALKYGAAYSVVLPGSPSPVVELLSPRRMTALYADPVSDEFPLLALDVNGSMMRLFDEASVYYIGLENSLQSALGGASAISATASLKFIERRDHDLGVTPVVRYREQMLLDGEEQYGIVEPLLDLDDRIRQTNYEQLVAQYFSAFKQRYVIGWTEQDESDRLKTSPGSIWQFKDTDVEVGTLQSTDIQPYLSARAANVRDFAAVAQLPAQSLGVDGISNISAEALAALEASKDRRSSEMQTSLGESHEQLFRLLALADGDTAGADDYDSEVRWQDFTARSYAQTVDGLTKIATMLDVPLELAWEGIPGWSNGQVSRAKALLADGSRTASDINKANAAQAKPVASADAPTPLP